MLAPDGLEEARVDGEKGMGLFYASTRLWGSLREIMVGQEVWLASCTGLGKPEN